MVDPFATQVTDPNSSTTGTTSSPQATKIVSFDPDDIFGGTPDALAAMQPQAFQPLDPETGQPIDHTQETLDPFLRDSDDEYFDISESSKLQAENSWEMGEETLEEVLEEKKEIQASEEVLEEIDKVPEEALEDKSDEISEKREDTQRSQENTSEDVINVDDAEMASILENSSVNMKSDVSEKSLLSENSVSFDESVAVSGESEDVVAKESEQISSESGFLEGLDPFVSFNVSSEKNTDYYDPFLDDSLIHTQDISDIQPNGQDILLPSEENIMQEKVNDTQSDLDIVDPFLLDNLDELEEREEFTQESVSEEDADNKIQDINDLQKISEEGEEETEKSEEDNLDELEEREEFTQEFVSEEDAENKIQDTNDLQESRDLDQTQDVVLEELEQQDGSQEEQNQKDLSEFVPVDVISDNKDLTSPVTESTQEDISEHFDESMDVDLSDNLDNKTELQLLVDDVIDPFLQNDSQVVSEDIQAGQENVQNISDGITEEVSEDTEKLEEDTDDVSDFFATQVSQNDQDVVVAQDDEQTIIEPTVAEDEKDMQKAGLSDVFVKFQELLQRIYRVHDDRGGHDPFTLVGADNDALYITYTFAIEASAEQAIIITKESTDRKDSDAIDTHVLRFAVNSDGLVEVYVDGILLFVEDQLVDNVKSKMQLMDKFNKFIFLVDQFIQDSANQVSGDALASAQEEFGGF